MPKWFRRSRVAWANHDLPVIAGAEPFFLERFPFGSEDIFVAAILQFGDNGMAREYRNSGNAKLQDAAKAWEIKAAATARAWD